MNMQKSTIYQNENEYAKLKQDHEILVIDNDEKEKKEKQLMHEKLEQFEAERKNALAKEKAELQIIKAETKKIPADSNLKVAGITRRRDVDLATIKAQGQAESD